MKEKLSQYFILNFFKINIFFKKLIDLNNEFLIDKKRKGQLQNHNWECGYFTCLVIQYNLYRIKLILIRML